MSTQPTMRLVTLMFDPSQGINSFRMIPVSIDCPYIDVVYHPSHKVLTIKLKEKESNLRMVKRLDDSGLPMTVPGKKKEGEDPYKYERKTIENHIELFITEKEEIKSFVKSMAVNHDSFDYAKYTDASNVLVAPPEQKIELLT